MNSKQAKETVKLVDVMQKLGYEVKAVERGGTEHKYLSPFRAEVDASFNLNLNKNEWFDFGLAEGGNVIDFAMHYLEAHGKPNTVADALRWYREDLGYGSQPSIFSLGSNSRPQAQIFENEAPRHLEFIKAAPLTSKMILTYLEGRMIPPTLAKQYFKLVQYKNHKQSPTRLYFGFGMENLSGGYEVRSASDEPGGKFQSALIARDISFYEGRQGRGEVAVFEGMLDYLSLLVMLKTDQLNSDVLILHSLTSFKRSVEFIREGSYTKINTFMDNDDSGQKTVGKFDEEFPEIHTSWSGSFAPHKDINKALVAGYVPKFSPGGTSPQP